ncbi:hypothetical protein CD035_13780 [Mammaliicoccus sciuri]|nr:hypothetical protein CD035_13780 [Mammaliicoccus sciuri]SQE49416.1 Z1 domain [Mammaliicoccus sciuri]
MNNKNVEALEKYAANYLDNLKENTHSDENTQAEEITYSEEDIKEAIQPFLNLVKGITEEEIERTIINLETRFNITMEQGSILRGTENYKKWYFGSKRKNGTAFWNRYRRYLEEVVRTPSQVIDQIDYAADEIMDNLANPKTENNFSRKGLVIGAVQSGKTSNYIGLMNKAADSGYKVIIVLTGTIEKLRKQTQERIDEGFIGIDSSAIVNDKKSRHVGVGKFDYLYGESLSVSPFTTTSDDFNIKASLKIEGNKGPVVFVLKKNKSVLEKLTKWLEIYNINQQTGTIESPLLLIDDEADNASVNTAAEDRDPTTINQLIRNILKLFSKSSYVGFTATPFANIFIDPQYQSDDGDDLFPRDFIYLLEQPSNYIGPTELYSSEGKYHYMIRNNDDVENVLKIKHKNGEFPTRLPDSLKEAIIVFFLSNAIRDLRGDEKKHRAMLIHISRFISVQDNIRDKVDSYVKHLQLKIQNYIYDDRENEIISEIHRIFEKEFGKSKVDGIEKVEISEEWNDVKNALLKAVMPIQVKVVNSGVASKNLDYDGYEDDGLRLIAIGGLSLARGLTLEGLMTSYFYRNTKMYDTLMQMGRWFGYRDGYADICRLWTSSESADWYEHIALATEELRYEIKKMDAQNKKPIEFGLKVRSAEDAPLIITARNKMRSADQMTLRRSVNGQMLETAILYKDSNMLKINNQVITKWLVKNQVYEYNDFDNLSLKKPTLKDVGKERIVHLLNSIEIPTINDIKSIINTMEENNSELFEKWDVVVASNKFNGQEEKIVQFGPFEINPLERSFDFFGDGEKFIRMSKGKKRLGQVSYARGGLTDNQYNEIKVEVDKQRKHLGKGKNGTYKSPSEYMYFNTGIERNPLLVIYPIKLKPSDDSNTQKFIENNSELVTGISIGIPDIEGSEMVTYEYAITVTKQRELLGIPLYEDEDEDEDEVDYNV